MKALTARHISLLRRLVAFLLLLGAWEGAARLRLVDPFFVPPPSRVAQVLWTLFVGGSIWQHLEATFSAALIGLALGLIAGTLLGFIAALTPLVAELLEPLMILLNAIPRVILAPLFVIWFGIGLGSKIAIAFVLVAVITFFAVYSGIREVDKRLIERVRTLGGGTWTLTREVYLPSVTTWVLSNLKVAVGFAFTGAVVGEFVAASRGLGYLLTFAQSTFNTAQVLAIIIVIMSFVLVLFSLAGLIEQQLLRWRNP
jgi:NitT/TauT family transport system permease protein